MWILSVDDFLKLDYMPQHEELIRRGVLVKRSFAWQLVTSLKLT